MAANRLLVLADDARVLSLLADAGRRSRYEVTPTQASSEFQDAYARTEPTLILIDLQHDDGSGADPIWFLIERTCTAPIILVSGSESAAIG